MASNHLVCRRPHFRLKDDALYFLASTRPVRKLSSSEIKIWEAIGQSVTIQDLRKRYPEADSIIEDFWRTELCEMLETAFSRERKRILVIEPHADDAALSVGGIMWQRRHTCLFSVVTLANRSNFTSYYTLGRDYFNVGQVMDIRRAESSLFARMIGGEYVEAGLTDVVLRYNDADWTLDYYLQRRISIAMSTSRGAGIRERRKWIDTVRRIVAENPSEEIWIPLGSPHSDHALTMNACLAAFVADPALIANRIVRIYQDVPYAARFPQFTTEMLDALKAGGVVFETESVSMDEATFSQKLRLISIYASQFKMHAMTSDIEASARMAQPGKGLSELLWRIHAMPRAMSASGIAPESTQVKQQEIAARRWLRVCREARVIRLLLLIPSGRWVDDIELLCELFPKAQFEVYAAPNAAVEIADVQSDRVRLQRVGAGPLAWLLLSIRLACSWPNATLFVVGEYRLREAQLLSRLWVGSNTLIVSSMNQVERASSAQIGCNGAGK